MWPRNSLIFVLVMLQFMVMDSNAQIPTLHYFTGGITNNTLNRRYLDCKSEPFIEDSTQRAEALYRTNQWGFVASDFENGLLFYGSDSVFDAQINLAFAFPNRNKKNYALEVVETFAIQDVGNPDLVHVLSIGYDPIFKHKDSFVYLQKVSISKSRYKNWSSLDSFGYQILELTSYFRLLQVAQHVNNKDMWIFITNWNEIQILKMVNGKIESHKTELISNLHITWYLGYKQPSRC